VCRIREPLHYRRDAFCAGLHARGYTVVPEISVPSPRDLLVIWNRYGRYHEEATRFEKCGARVIVAENGYLGKGWRGGDWYALALGHHGGAGWWRNGGPQRWDGWGVPLASWRREGKEIVILGQRSIGEPGLASPRGWEARMQALIPGARVRPHPGKHEAPDLLQDLANAKAVVTWSSGAALIALMAGIPVWRNAPWWIGAGAALPIGMGLLRNDEARLAMFRRLAWAQWTLEEIARGEAFAHLLVVE